MKKTTICLLLAILIVTGASLGAAAQVIEVCGNDTITLRAGNYQRGTMRWEKSQDMETWQAIAGEVDTIYRFLPHQTMYYRCVSKFPDCPPEFSQISLVRVPPVANAGISRVVLGTQVRLAANTEEGATGQWTVLEGNGGAFNDPSLPSAILQGMQNEAYKLLWTLTNVCGSSFDTLDVEFVTNEYRDNFVVVDTTDLIISNDTQLANGEYVIRFSSPAPAISDSTVLIGMQLGGFLRMVESISVDIENGDTLYTMQTIQADLDDITVNAAFNFGDLVSIDSTLTDDRSAGYRRLNRMPTRQELLNNQKFRNSDIHYYIIGEKTTMPEGVSVQRSTNKNGSTLFSFNFESAKIIDTMGVEVKISGNYEYIPNLVVDRKRSWLGGTNYFKMGTSNSQSNTTVNLDVDVNATVTLLKRKFTVYKETLYFVVIAGGAPILFDVTFKLNGKAGAEAGIMITAKPHIKRKTVSSNYIEYQNSSWSVTRESSSDTQADFESEITGGLKQTFEFGPELSFNIYTVVGPYASYKLEQELVLCTTLEMPPTGWAANVEIGGEGKLGAKGQIFGKELLDYYVSWKTDKWKYTFPDSLEIIRGNRMSYEATAPPNERQIPVEVQVHGSRNYTLPLAMVIFEPDSTSSVGNSPQGEPYIAYADVLGIARTYWTPGDTIKSRLAAYVFDCKGNHIKNSPLEFIAYADTTDPCMASNLSANLVFVRDSLSVEAKLGAPPYLYSLDGGSFAEEAPVILPIPHAVYSFAIKDSLECETTLIYEVPDPCDQYSISVDYAIYPDNVYVFDAQGGTAPYLYSLNDNNTFFENNIFNDLHIGFHRVYAQDSLGCVGYVEFGEESIQVGNLLWLKHNLEVDVGNNWWPEGIYCGDIDWGLCGNIYWKEHTEYGRLYDWESAIAACESIGWRLPTDDEWQQLVDYWGGEYVAGGKLKSTLTGEFIDNFHNNPEGHPFWYEPNFGATNESGFSALPGSDAAYFLDISLVGLEGKWWSSTESSSTNAWYRSMSNVHDHVDRGHAGKSAGLSLRCVRDID